MRPITYTGSSQVPTLLSVHDFVLFFLKDSPPSNCIVPRPVKPWSAPSFMVSYVLLDRGHTLVLFFNFFKNNLHLKQNGKHEWKIIFKERLISMNFQWLCDLNAFMLLFKQIYSHQTTMVPIFAGEERIL